MGSFEVGNSTQIHVEDYYSILYYILYPYIYIYFIEMVRFNSLDVWFLRAGQHKIS